MNRLTGLIFVVAFTCASAQYCGGERKGPNGTVTSPNWPASYPDNAKCDWTITVGEGNTLGFVFRDFQLEPVSPAVGCLSTDYVMIVDGEETYGPYCGFAVPPKITSKTNKLVVIFRSDATLNYRGFLATYIEIYNTPITTTTPVPTGPTTKYPPTINCGIEQVADSGFFTSPKYPKNYPDNADCGFFIKLEASTTGSITLTFNDFQVENSENCKADSLKVHDGNNGYAPVVATLCGKEAIKPIITSGKAVYLRFTTDAANTGRGFNISWARSSCEEVGGVCAESCKNGELDGQLDTCNKSTLKCCKPAPADPICGKRFISDGDLPYIVGGREATPNSWPWQLSLQSGTTHFCGAVLLSDEWAVTAAHCVHDETIITVVAGEHDRQVPSGDEVRVIISNIIVHEQFVNQGPWPNDIALLRLSEKLTLGPKIFPACFPQMEDMEFGSNDTCYITGWGDTKGTGDRILLNELRIKPMSNDVCRLSWADSILDTHICVGDGTTGACQGDSGGPLVCKKEGKWFLGGVTSWVVRGCRKEGFPSVYTRVAKYKSWVDEKIKENGGY